MSDPHNLQEGGECPEGYCRECWLEGRSEKLEGDLGTCPECTKDDCPKCGGIDSLRMDKKTGIAYCTEKCGYMTGGKA